LVLKAVNCVIAFYSVSRVFTIGVKIGISFVVTGKHTVYRMSAATPEEKDDWIKCVR
jgi:hypothetical protein